MFPLCFGLLVDFIHVVWVEANAELAGKSYPLFAVTDRIPHTNHQSKYYTNVENFTQEALIICRLPVVQMTKNKGNKTLIEVPLG